MLATEVVLRAEDAIGRRNSRDELRVGLVVPQSGVMGLTGPAAIASAVLAAEELSQQSARRVTLVPVDAGDSAVEGLVGRLVTTGSVHALCGFSTSDVLRRLERVVAGRVPFLFTPPHEGGRHAPGVALMGPGPREQLAPVIDKLGTNRNLRRWALIGNDYIWPQRVHAAASALLQEVGAQVVADVLVPISAVDADRLIDEVRRARAQAILISLVGRDLATFNRAFAESGLASRIVRVSGALEETGLLEIDGDDSGELFASMPWYASDPDDVLATAYDERWGSEAPALGAYAAGCYDGIHLLAGVLADRHAVHEFAPRVDAQLRRRRQRIARAEGLDLRPVGP